MVGAIILGVKSRYYVTATHPALTNSCFQIDLRPKKPQSANKLKKGESLYKKLEETEEDFSLLFEWANQLDESQLADYTVI